MDVDAQRKFDTKMNEIIKKLPNVVTNAVTNKEILDSILEKIIAEKRFEKEMESKTVQPNLDAVLRDDNNLGDFKSEPPKIILINEDDYKNNPVLADTDIDFQIINSVPAPSYSTSLVFHDKHCTSSFLFK